MAVAVTRIMWSRPGREVVFIEPGEEIPDGWDGDPALMSDVAPDVAPNVAKQTLTVSLADDHLAGLTVNEVLAWVEDGGVDDGPDSQRDRVQRALTFELSAQGKGRAGVVNALRVLGEGE